MDESTAYAITEQLKKANGNSRRLRILRTIVNGRQEEPLLLLMCQEMRFKNVEHIFGKKDKGESVPRTCLSLTEIRKFVLGPIKDEEKIRFRNHLLDCNKCLFTALLFKEAQVEEGLTA